MIFWRCKIRSVCCRGFHQICKPSPHNWCEKYFWLDALYMRRLVRNVKQSWTRMEPRIPPSSSVYRTRCPNVFSKATSFWMLKSLFTAAIKKRMASLRMQVHRGSLRRETMVENAVGIARNYSSRSRAVWTQAQKLEGIETNMETSTSLTTSIITFKGYFRGLVLYGFRQRP